MDGSSASFSHLVPELMERVPRYQMERYRRETCVNGDLDYKLEQLLPAAANDAVNGRVVDRAVHVIDQCLLIRDVLRIPDILEDNYFPTDLAQELEEWSCMSVVGEDVRGNTIIYFNLKKFDPTVYAGIWKRGQQGIPTEFVNHPEFDDPTVVNYCSLWYVRMMEWIHKHRFDQFKAGVVSSPRVIMILNVESIGFSTYSHELKQFLRGIRILGGYLFPEICDFIFAANVPWLADKFWSVIKLVLHPATASKVDLYDKNRTKKLLPTLVENTHLPPCFGGPCIPETGFKSASSSIAGNKSRGSPSTLSSELSTVEYP